MSNPGPRGPDKGLALGQKYFAAGLRFAGGIVLFTLGGFGLDRWLNTIPLFTIAGTLAGGTLSFLSVYRQLVQDKDVDADGPAKR
ncbi:MAG TPA: AtpZ/AtpI family protein [Gemmatimonadales bacterium]